MEAVQAGVDSAEKLWFYVEQRGGGAAAAGGAGAFQRGSAK